MKLIKLFLLLSLAAYVAYGAILFLVLDIMDSGKLSDLNGFDSVAVVLGMFPVLFVAAFIPVMIYGAAYAFISWLIKL